MKNYFQIALLIVLAAVITSFAVLLMFSFGEDEKVLFGLNMGEIQAYSYFICTMVIVALLVQYGYSLFVSKDKDGEDYESRSDIMLYDDYIVEEKTKQSKTVDKNIGDSIERTNKKA
jgi:cbb3-type cytochrome oxidase subunit 3